MRFLCVCLSPAIDATVRLDAWPSDGCIIKDAVDTFALGGKGLNAARWLAVRSLAEASGRQAEGVRRELTQHRIACGGLLGTDNAAIFEREMAKYGIEDRFVRVAGATRVNERFVTPQGCFKVNRPAFSGITVGTAVPSGPQSFFNEDSFDRDCGALRTTRPTTVILSGSLPKDFPVDYYGRLVEAAKAVGAKTVLDASGKALVEGAKAHPDVLKPNAEECEALVGFVPKVPDDFRKATAALKAFCDYPIISDGAAGCWFDGAFVPAPEVEVLDTTAAGDTLLAEWCFSGDSRRAVAAGSAACTMPGGEPPSLALVDSLLEAVAP